ncbi:uncharacterized protein At4g18490 [Gastrolobium bilobum]|uniref:uncharacterized protein At4g18490 n=1 Tax=Gastrolobium bilobum TaxID=150636 RepID=UPI002AB15933|nr:uncharacterized protein At4g18490 [Gastrolobium bilobum]
MAEQQKESSSADSKERSSLPDDGIGKEFLSSWKSMSMADDNAMDFSFDTVSKGKKKTFDFEKLLTDSMSVSFKGPITIIYIYAYAMQLDMDFNLDGEFDKISSFKVDMSDLDFTCPPKKTSQSKDKKEASGAKAGKQDGFNFSFDFNELDSFNLDSSLIKVDTTSNINQRKKGVTAEESDNEDAKKPKTNDDGGVHASNDSKAMKPPASERLETLKVDTLVDNLGNLVSKQDGSVSKFSSSQNLDMSIESQTSAVSRSISTEEMDQERDIPEKTKSTESKSEQVIDKAPFQSTIVQSDSEEDTISEQHTKVFSSGTKVINFSGDKQEVNEKATHVDSNGLDLQLEHSSPPHITKSDSSIGEAINVGSSTREGVTNDPQPEKSDTSCENITKNDASKKNSCENDIRENKKSTLECHLASASSNPVVDKVVQKKDRELQVMPSNMLSRTEDKRPLKHPSSTAGTNGISFGCSVKLMRDAPALLGSKDDLKSCSSNRCIDDIFAEVREGIVSDVMPRAGKLAGNLQSFREEVNKSKPIFLQTSISAKDVDMLGSQVSPSCLTEKTATKITQMSVNCQAEASCKDSSHKSRTTSIEGNKPSFKICKITPALSSFKKLRNVGTNRAQETSLRQKETNSLVSSEQSMEMQGITASKNDHLTDSGGNQKPSTQFLKRKTIEVSEADLTSLRSLKRLSQSPSKSRSSKESSEVVEQVESKPNNILYNHSTSGLESPSEIKVMEVEIPDSVLMEDNSNVEKAEAYMKELEDEHFRKGKTWTEDKWQVAMRRLRGSAIKLFRTWNCRDFNNMWKDFLMAVVTKYLPGRFDLIDEEEDEIINDDDEDEENDADEEETEMAESEVANGNASAEEIDVSSRVRDDSEK